MYEGYYDIYLGQYKVHEGYCKENVECYEVYLGYYDMYLGWYEVHVGYNEVYVV